MLVRGETLQGRESDGALSTNIARNPFRVYRRRSELSCSRLWIDVCCAKTPVTMRYADASEAATALEGAFRQMLKSEVEM